MSYELETARGKHILVTGATDGIGLATAQALARGGARLLVHGRNPAKVESVAQSLGAVGLVADLSDLAQVRRLAAEVAAHGPLDVLLNNAGIFATERHESVEGYELTFAVKHLAPFLLTLLLLDHLRPGARIVNVSSIAGELTLPGEGAYHASKYAVEAFSDALRVEVAPFGVEVALVQPTGVRTAFFDAMGSTTAGGDPGPYRQLVDGWRAMLERTQQSRFGLIEPADVARVIVRAATASHPKARYKAGWSGADIAGVRTVMPDSAWDAAMRRGLGLPKPPVR